MSPTLIIASDLSDRSDLALQAAPFFATRMGAGRIVLLHVVDDVGGEPVAAAEIEIEGAELLREARRLSGVAVETRVLVGTPDEEILRHADEVAAGLILVGAPRSRRFLDRMRGTTADRLMRRGRCPVAMIIAPLPALRPTVLFATDLTPRADRALQVSADLGLTRDVALRVLSADEMLVAPARGADAAGAQDMFGGLIRRNPDLETRLRRHYHPQQFAGGSVDYIAAQGSAVSAIRQVARHCRADLVVIGTRGRGALASLAFGSTASELLGRPVTNLLIVPDTATAERVLPPKGPVIAAIDPARLAWQQPVLSRAVEAGAARGAPVHVLAVLDGALSARASTADRLSLIAADLSAVRTRVAAWLETCGTGDEVLEVVFGHPDEEIVRAADRHGAQAIVLGTSNSGRSYGGVVERVQDSGAYETILSDTIEP